MRARVLLVEPNRLLREGIRAELARKGAEVVAEASSGAEAMAAADEHEPDVVLLELTLPDSPATQVCEQLRRQHPSTRIIVLADPVDTASVGSAIESGAHAYLLKDAQDLDVAAAVERVLAGESVIDPRATAALLESRRSEDTRLSRQELNVLRLVAEGLTNPEIGDKLFLSRHTVKEYLSHAMRKLEVTNRIEAVRKATELGLIEGPTRSPGRGPLAYNVTGEPADSTDLKVTPLKLDQLRLRANPDTKSGRPG